MANSPQAKKRARQNDKRRAHNHSRRSMMRTYIKNVRKALLEGDKARAEEAFKKAVPVIDRMANRGLLHMNAAARYKSRLNNAIRAMA